MNGSSPPISCSLVSTYDPANYHDDVYYLALMRLAFRPDDRGDEVPVGSFATARGVAAPPLPWFFPTLTGARFCRSPGACTARSTSLKRCSRLARDRGGAVRYLDSVDPSTFVGLARRRAVRPKETGIITAAVS